MLKKKIQLNNNLFDFNYKVKYIASIHIRFLIKLLKICYGNNLLKCNYKIILIF